MSLIWRQRVYAKTSSLGEDRGVLAWRQSSLGRRLESLWEDCEEWRALGYLCEREVIFLRYLCVRGCFLLGSDIAPGARQVVWNVHPCDPRDPWRVSVDKWSYWGSLTLRVEVGETLARNVCAGDTCEIVIACGLDSYIPVPDPDWGCLDFDPLIIWRLRKKIPVWVWCYQPSILVI